MKDCAILILSCDKYSDIWEPFFRFFFKYWPDCPYPVYLGTNELLYTETKVSVIRSGPAKDWSSDTRRILEQIQEKYLIVLLEDYWLKGHPDADLLNKSCDLMRKTGAGFLRLACFPSDHFPDYSYKKIPGDEWCGLTELTARYRVHLQAGIWDRKYFLDLLRDGESAWDFEIKGTERSMLLKEPLLGLCETPGIREVHGPIPYLCTAVTKGKWMLDAVQMAKDHEVPIDLSKRPVETRLRYILRKIYHWLPYWTRRYMDFLHSLPQKLKS